MRLLLLEEGHCFRDQALSFCEMGANRPREMLDGSSLSTLVQMVNAGIGVTLLPEMALDVETRSADVSVHRFPAPRPARSIGMIWRASTPLAVQLDQLAEIVRDTGRASSWRPLVTMVLTLEKAWPADGSIPFTRTRMFCSRMPGLWETRVG